MTRDESRKKEREAGKIREGLIQLELDGPTPNNTHKIEYRGKLREFPVYQIPLSSLIYNKFNGRILSETKSMESLGKEIVAYTAEGKEIIEKLLWESDLKRNNKTLGLLDRLGQEKIAVISRDGVIIDGNRRTMLLNKLPQYDYLDAIVLPLLSYEDNLEIENIETQLQMGGDKAIDYDPIQIYLKIQSMYIQMCDIDRGGFESEEIKSLIFKPKFDKDNKNTDAIEKIYGKIGSYKTIDTSSDVEFFLKVMDTMDEYLHSLDIPEAYPALEGKEEQFRGLTTTLSQYYGETSKKPFREYTDDDVDDYKLLAFDFIRMKQKNEDFRLIGNKKQREFHIIGEINRWQKFYEQHKKIKDQFEEDPFSIDDILQIKNILNSRDADFKKANGEDFYINFGQAVDKVKLKQKTEEPDKLVTAALDALNAINPKNNIINTSKVQNKVKEVTQIAIQKLGSKAQLFLLNKINIWLDKILNEDDDVLSEFDSDSEDKDEIISTLLHIQKKSFDASKILKKRS